MSTVPQPPVSGSKSGHSKAAIALSWALLGATVGVGASALAVSLFGNEEFQPAPDRNPSQSNTQGGPGGAAPSGPGGMGAMGGMGPGMGGMDGMGGGFGRMGAMAGMDGMGGGFGGGNRAKRDLTALVGKLALARKGIQVRLEAEQAQRIAARVAELEKAETMTDEQAEKALGELRALLSEEQTTTLASFELPRPARSMGLPSTTIAGGGGGMPGARGPGAAANDENPFKQEANQKYVQDLLKLLQAGAETP